jgi:hypothetical protein
VRLYLLATFFAGFATAGMSDVCLMKSVAANISDRDSFMIDWAADPGALAYCGGPYTLLEFCIEPSLNSGCHGTSFDAWYDFSLRVDELLLVDGVLFGRTAAFDSCKAGETFRRYLILRNLDCAFRP